jgi:hypothetical protein
MITLPLLAEVETESEFGGKLLGYTPDGAPIYQISGSQGRGYSTAGDTLRHGADADIRALVSNLSDGTNLNDIWNEFQQTLDIINEQRSAVTNLLAFRTTAHMDVVAQSFEGPGFVRASEFGEPISIAAKPDALKLGYEFIDFDLAARYTWRFLRDALRSEVEMIHRQALHDDNKLCTNDILRRLLNSSPGLNDEGITVYPLYNGDGMVPPRSGFNTHTAPHTHYLTPGSASADGGDLDVMIDHISHHGYTSVPGSQLVLFVHPSDLSQIAAIRAGTLGATYDFIPSAGAPAFMTAETIVGDRAPAEFNGLKVVGSYGKVWVIPSEYMVPDYLLMAATNGPNSPWNPVGFREHPSVGQQGLRLLPGNQVAYPLIESYYLRAFGTGVRHRGAAVAMQITAAGTYTVPTGFVAEAGL